MYYDSYPAWSPDGTKLAFASEHLGDEPDAGECGCTYGQAGENDNVRGDVEQLSGGQAGDRLKGDQRANRLNGNQGDDTLIGGGGPDKLLGGVGDDTLDGRDDARDTLHCADGFDTALTDLLDWLSSACENR